MAVAVAIGAEATSGLESSSGEEDFLKVAVPIIPEQYYFARLTCAPRTRSDFFFFTTDFELVYDSFYDDFGPLNIAKVYRYCEKVQGKLHPENTSTPLTRILHYSAGTDERKFVNAAWLVGAYSIIKLGQSPEKVLEILEKAAQQRILIAFRDASCGPSTYRLNLSDCLSALHKAVQLKFFEYDRFDLQEYEHYERVENGDFNWITPKLLAFCGPHQKTRTEGYPVHAPEEYFKYFKSHGVSTIVRLNSPQYSSDRFTAAGFDHKDLIFPDGTTPGDDILYEFLRIVETAKGGVAVHCKAGLGRTGTLIAAFLMKHHHFTASEAIAWVRIVRPGSVIGQQQHYLESVKDRLWADGKNGLFAESLKTSNLNVGYLNGLPPELNVDGVNGPGESVEVTSMSSSTEYTDASGVTTVHEDVVVEKKIITVAPKMQLQAHPSEVLLTEDEGQTTQGDDLNARKAMRDKARQNRCHTRSMNRSVAAESSSSSPNLQRRVSGKKAKGKKAKKLKIK